jgi:hypothetical protein
VLVLSSLAIWAVTAPRLANERRTTWVRTEDVRTAGSAEPEACRLRAASLLPEGVRSRKSLVVPDWIERETLEAVNLDWR